MALTVRDLFLSVRIEDRATRPLRGIAAQLDRMAATRARAGSRAGADLQRRNENIIRQQQRLATQITAVQPGGREYQRSLERQTANAERLTKERAKLGGIERDLRTNIAGQANGMKALAAQQAIVNAGRKAGLAGTGIPVGRSGLQGMERELAKLQRIEDSAREKAAQTIAKHQTQMRNLIADQRVLPLQIAHRANIESLARQAAAEEGVSPGQALIGQTPIPLYAEQTERLRRRLAAARETSIRLGQTIQTVAQDAGVAQSKIAAQIAAQEKAVATAREAGVGTFSASGRRTLEEHERILQRLRQNHVDLAATGEKLAANYGRQTATVSTLTTRNGELAASFAALQEREAQLLATSQALEGELAKNAAQIQRISAVEQRYSRTQDWRNRATSIRRAGQAMIFFGGAATVALGIAAKQAADFNTQVRLAATQAVKPGQGVQGVLRVSRTLQNQIMQIVKSGRTVSTPSEQARAAYEIFSGVTLKGSQLSQLRQGITLLREFNKVVVANFGLVTLEEATRAGIVVLNNFGATVKTIPRDLNTMQAAVRFGRLTMSEFVATLNQAAPAARGAHYNFNQMAAAIAFVSRVFPSVRIGATGYARLLEAFSRKDVVQGLHQHGVEITRTVNGVTRLLPITEIAARVLQRFGGRVKEGSIFLQNFFKEIGNTQSTVQARRVLVAYVTHLGLARTILRQVTNDTGELNRSQAALQATPAVRLAEAMNQFRAVMIELGAAALPVFAQIGQYVLKAINWFNQLSPSTRRAIGYFSAIAAVGTVLAGALLTLAGGLASMALGLRLIVTGRLLSTLGAEAGFISARFAVMLTGIGLITYAFIRWPGLFRSIAHALNQFARSTIGVHSALELLATGAVVSSLLKMTGVFRLLGLSAAANIGKIAALRLALLRLGAVGLVATTILFIVDAKFRHNAEKFIGDFMHGRMDWQVRFDNWIGGFKQRLHNNVSKFGLGFLVPEPEIRWTRSHTRAVVNQAHVLDTMFSPVRNLHRQAAREARQIQNRRIVIDVARMFNVRGVTATPKLMTAFRAYENAIEKVKDTRKALAATNREGQADYMGSYARWRAAVDALAASHRKLNAVIRGLVAQGAIQRFKAITQAAEQLGVTNITPSFKKLFDNLIKAKQLVNAAVAAEKKNPSGANVQAMYRAYAAFARAKSALEASATKEQASAAESAANKVADAQKAALQKQKDNVKTAIDNVSQMYQDMLQQNQSSFGQLFSGPWLTGAVMNFRKEWGLMPTGGDLLKDLRGQVNNFRRFQTDLNKLQRRGAPPELINQIRQMGPEALPMIDILTKMQPRQWRAYVAAFQQGQNLIKRQTMKDLNSQLALYRKFGTNVGKQIVLGIREQNAPMRSEIRSLVLRMFPELAPHRQNQRGNAARPPAHHNRTRPQTHRPPVHHHHHPTTHHQNPDTEKKQGDTYHYHDHWDIHQKPNEDLATVLQRVRFRQKNRPRIRR